MHSAAICTAGWQIACDRPSQQQLDIPIDCGHFCKQAWARGAAVVIDQGIFPTFDIKGKFLSVWNILYSD